MSSFFSMMNQFPHYLWNKTFVLDWIVAPNLSCPSCYRIIHPGPLPYDFVALEGGCGHVTCLANGMLKMWWEQRGYMCLSDLALPLELLSLPEWDIYEDVNLICILEPSPAELSWAQPRLDEPGEISSIPVHTQTHEGEKLLAAISHWYFGVVCYVVLLSQQ